MSESTRPAPTFAIRRGEFAPDKVVLHVGAGLGVSGELAHLFPHDQWRELRLDLDPQTRPHIIGSMTDLSMIEDGAVDGIFSRCSLEHLFYHDVERALAEFMRVLATPGMLAVFVPDLLKIAQEIVAGRLHEPSYDSQAGAISPFDMMYGLKSAIAEGREGMAHRSGFTPQSLCDVLTKQGFSPVTVHEASWNILGLAHKTVPGGPLATTLDAALRPPFP